MGVSFVEGDKVTAIADALAELNHLISQQNAAIDLQTAAIASQGARRPESYADFQAIVRMGLARLVYKIGDIIQVARESAVQISLGEHTGIAAAEIVEETFVEAVGEAGEKEYEIRFDGSAWILDGTPIILADYGITVTGTAAEGDTLVVVETASVINFVIVGFIDNRTTGAITIKNKDLKYGVILQAESILYSLQFDAPEAFAYFADGLAAGTYNFTIDPTYDTTYGGGKTLQFTLAQAVPAGGQLCFSWAYQTQATAGKVTSYASPTSTTVIEQVTVSEGDDGTSLGTILNATIGAETTMNSISRARYGSNRYSTSAIRQQLNSKKKAGEVWTPQHNFDRPPTWAGTTAGFRHGLDPAFDAIVAEVEIETVLNTVADTTSAEATAGTGFDKTVDKYFLASSRELFGTKKNNSDHGVPLDYYANNSANVSASDGADANRIKRGAVSENPTYYWTRDPNTGHGIHVRHVSPSTGQIYNYYANVAEGAPQACIVA